MRTIVTTVAAFAVLAAVIGAQSQGTLDAETARLILRNERALYDAIAKGDKAAYQALVFADGKWATPAGLVPIESLADRLGQFELPNWQIENPSVAALDDRTVALVYTRSGGGRFGERPFAPLMLASTQWAKRGSQWVAFDHWEKALTGSSLIPVEGGPWQLSFAEVEAAAGLADLRTASAETVEARVMDRPSGVMPGLHTFLRIVRRDGRMRAELFLFGSPGQVERLPARKDTACRDRVCVYPVELKEQLDWDPIVKTLADEDGCGLIVGGPNPICGDCEEAWMKSAKKGRYREQVCQLPEATSPAKTLLQFMVRSARAAGY